MTALEEVADADIKLLVLIKIVDGELAQLEDRDELGIGSQGGIGAEVRGNLLGFALQNEGAAGLDGVVVGESQIDRLIDADERRGLCDGRCREEGRGRRIAGYPAGQS